MRKNTVSYTPLDLQCLSQKKCKIVSSKEALKDVKPIKWSNDILTGKKKVTIVQAKE